MLGPPGAKGRAAAPLAGSGNGGGGRRVNPRACTGGGKPGGGDGPYNRPRRAVPTSRPLLQASPLASAAAVTATGLSLSSAGAGSSIISTSGLGLPSGGLLASRGAMDDVSVEVAPAGLTPTTLYMNKQASLAECCVPNARYRAVETFPFPLPFEQQGMRI